MSGPRVFLAARPYRYGHGPDLPVGTYHVVQVGDGEWTVQRSCNYRAWYPLTARENPAWLTWPTEISAENWAHGQSVASTEPGAHVCARCGFVGFWAGGPHACHDQGYDCSDWPHWGSLS